MLQPVDAIMRRSINLEQTSYENPLHNLLRDCFAAKSDRHHRENREKAVLEAGKDVLGLDVSRYDNMQM